MLPREWFRRHEKRVGPRIQKVGKCRIQLIEIARTDGVQQDVRLIGGDFCFTHACRHARVRRIPQDRNAGNPRSPKSIGRDNLFEASRLLPTATMALRARSNAIRCRPECGWNSVWRDLR